MISDFTDVIQENVQPKKITPWLEHCSKAFEVWNNKKASRTTEDLGKNKRRSEEIESGEVVITDPSPPKKIKKKVLVPDDNPQF